MNRYAILLATLASVCVLGEVRAVELEEVQTFPSPGNAVQMEYSSEFGLLFLRNSGSAIRVLDTNTENQIEAPCSCICHEKESA